MQFVMQRFGAWNQGGRMDRLAMLLSLLCAVHCIGSAILIAVLASAGGVLVSHEVHEIGLVLAIILSVIAIGQGAMTHGYLLPVSIGSLGIGVMAGALNLPHHAEAGLFSGEIFFTLVGVSIVALAHDLNQRASR